MKPIRAILLLGAVACALMSCELIGEGALPAVEDAPAARKGGLVLTLNDGFARTLAPPIVMEIGSFDIRGTGPDPDLDTFVDLGNTSGVLALSDLSSGLWTILVDAHNPSGIIIGHGETQVTIAAYSVTSATVVIAPLTGLGTLHLTLTFPVNTIKKTGGVEATLTPTGGDPVPLVFSLGPNPNNPTEATYRDEALLAGYYLLILRLIPDDGPVWGTVEAVRIVEGQVTTGSWGLN